MASVTGCFLTYFDDHKGQSLLWSRTKRKSLIISDSDRADERHRKAKPGRG